MKKITSLLLVFTFLLTNFSYAYAYNEDVKTERETILKSVYEQLKAQGVEDQFDKWVKTEVEKNLIQMLSHFIQPIQIDQI